jgi:predicted RNA binding protein YcfA (HicA-like mRNA interferase family)
MKRRDVERHLRQHGCTVLREGGRHTLYTKNGRTSALPRHSEIKNPVVADICAELGIPSPFER